MVAREESGCLQPDPRSSAARAVELARRREKAIAQIAKDLGVAESGLRRWTAQADIDGASAPSDGSTPASPPGERPYRPGCTSTTITGSTPRSVYTARGSSRSLNDVLECRQVGRPLTPAVCDRAQDRATMGC